RFSQVCARWRSCSMPAAQTPCWKWARLRRRPARSASLWSHRRSVELRISRLRSTPSGGRTDALHVCSSPALTTNRIRVNSLALGGRRPTMHGLRDFTVSGGLMSYGPNLPSLFRRAGDYVDKILRGAKPKDLPVEQPTKFDLVINVTTAKALGLQIPDRLL